MKLGGCQAALEKTLGKSTSREEHFVGAEAQVLADRPNSDRVMRCGRLAAVGKRAGSLIVHSNQRVRDNENDGRRPRLEAADLHQCTDAQMSPKSTQIVLHLGCLWE